MGNELTQVHLENKDGEDSENTAYAYFSLSPSHFDTRSEDDTEKNVELPASVATAFAKYDFPVPGGYMHTFHQLTI